jgi:hypothetical protein
MIHPFEDILGVTNFLWYFRDTMIFEIIVLIFPILFALVFYRLSLALLHCALLG